MDFPADQGSRLPGGDCAPGGIRGLIWAYRFREGYPPEALEPDGVSAALAAEDGWLWLHFTLTDQRARAWIGQLEVLPKAARAPFLVAEEQLGLHAENDVIFGVIADFHGDLGEETNNIGRLRLVLSERLVISGRRHPLSSVEAIHRAVKDGMPLPAAGALIETIIDRFCDTVASRVAVMIDELDAAEEHVVGDLASVERNRLNLVRRTMVRMHRQLSSLANVLRNWDNRPKVSSPPSLHIAAGRLASRLESLDHDIHAVQDRARLLQDEVAARQADDTNRSLRALSIITALLLPGSMVAGIFGMNTKDLPFTDTAGGFWLAMLIGIAATLAFYWILRRIGAGLRL